MVFTVEADDKDDAKVQFCHTLPMQSGKPVTGCSIDFRTIKLSKDSTDDHYKRLKH